MSWTDGGATGAFVAVASIGGAGGGVFVGVITTDVSVVGVGRVSTTGEMLLKRLHPSVIKIRNNVASFVVGFIKIGYLFGNPCEGFEIILGNRCLRLTKFIQFECHL